MSYRGRRNNDTRNIRIAKHPIDPVGKTHVRMSSPEALSRTCVNFTHQRQRTELMHISDEIFTPISAAYARYICTHSRYSSFLKLSADYYIALTQIALVRSTDPRHSSSSRSLSKYSAIFFRS